jgi:hypothetical protein
MTPAQKRWIDGEGKKLGYRICGVTGAISYLNISSSEYREVRWISANGEVRKRQRAPDDMQVGIRHVPDPQGDGMKFIPLQPGTRT